jgi:RHS repeat-associated protein
LVDGIVVAFYTYDNNGNTKSRTVGGVTTNYVWDDQNRMVQVQTPTETVTYKYDDDNIRVSETVDGTTKNYVLDKNRPYAQVLAEYEDGNLEASYTYGLDLIEQERDGNESYYSVDGLGSTRGLTDENGEVTDTYIYDAYGNVVGSAGTTANDYRFAGEQFDGTLGQYYLRQRYYDPNSGRFTRRDTWEGRHQEPITLHKYLYANSNPVSYVDPSGLFSLAEVQAARQVRNTLAEAQFASYSDLIRNTDSDGLGGQVANFFDKIQTAVSLTHLASAFPFGVGRASASLSVKVPGRVQSRINLSKKGLEHVLKRHFGAANASRFSISFNTLKELLQNDAIVKVPVTRTVQSSKGIQYIREVDFGSFTIGKDKFNGNTNTAIMTIMTDKFGNLETVFPGRIT